MVIYEFEFFSPENERPEIVQIELHSNTEAEITAYKWLREKRAGIYRQLHPRMTRPERKYVLSALALYHVSVARPIARNEFGEPDYNERKTR